MGRLYSHLSLSEREEISRGLAQGLSKRAIARLLKRDPGAICREIQQHASPVRRSYRAALAHSHAAFSSRIPRRPRKLADPWLWNRVLDDLRCRWSPEQIARRLKRDYPDDMAKQISHESIYMALYVTPRGHLRRELLAYLRQGRKRRRPRSRGVDRRGQIPNMKPIADRPANVESRGIPGHWEGDLLKGARNASSVGTLVERTTRFTLLARMDGCSAEDARRAFEKKLRTIPPWLRKTLTYDRGKEMAEHEALAKNLKIDVFFADPHSPWQRGTNENTNGLLRQFFPKGTNLSKINGHQLNHVAWLLNGRPRKCLGWDSPFEALQKLVHNQDVALGT